MPSPVSKRSTLLITRRILTAVIVLAGMALGQTDAGKNATTEPKNPLAGNSQAIQEGRSQFRFNCSMCHGVEAQGTQKAPSLTTGRWAHGGSDGELFRTIQHGVAGTLMPAQESILTETETWQVISYLRSLQKPASLAGDAARGKEIFIGDGSCLSCHMVNGHGGAPGAGPFAGGRGALCRLPGGIHPPAQRAPGRGHH